jgi:hypothetical protein
MIVIEPLLRLLILFLRHHPGKLGSRLPQNLGRVFIIDASKRPRGKKK